MYIRFIVQYKDEDSGRRMGIFQALAELRDQGELYNYELDQMKEIHDWFDKNLNKPDHFNRSNRPNTKNKAISWFKDSAISHILKMREIVSILESHNLSVEVIKTESPGYVVYEDEFQVTAEAFRDTGA